MQIDAREAAIQAQVDAILEAEPRRLLEQRAVFAANRATLAGADACLARHDPLSAYYAHVLEQRCIFADVFAREAELEARMVENIAALTELRRKAEKRAMTEQEVREVEGRLKRMKLEEQ